MTVFKVITVLAFVMFTTVISAKADTPVSDMPAGLYSLDKNHSSLHVKIDHVGLSKYTIRFDDFDSVVQLDPQNITQSRVRATIDMTSVNTGHPNEDGKDFDKKLSEGKEWLNTETFPKAEFISRGVEKTGDNTAVITGDLTFMGVTKPVTLNATLNAALGNHPFLNKPALGISATGSFKRSDFGLKTYIPHVGDEVQIVIEAEYVFGYTHGQ